MSWKDELAVIEKRLFQAGLGDRDVYHLTHALKEFGEHADPGARNDACRIAMRYVRACLDEDDNSIANYVSSCLAAIAAAGPADEQALLAQAIRSKLQPWARGSALKRLAKLEGAAGIERLCDALSDSDLRKAAAEGLAKLAGGTASAGVLGALAAALDTEKYVETIEALVNAVMAVGGETRAILEAAAARVDRNAAMSMHWFINGIRPGDVAKRLAAAGVIPMPSKEKLARYESDWVEDRDASPILWDMIGSLGRLTAFDCKTGDSPADHVDLVQWLGNIATDDFVLEDVSQVAGQGPDGGSEVRFTHGGRGYAFATEHAGRYYDLRGVLNGLNGVLAGLGRPQRFIQLHTDGVVAVILFAPEARFLEVARDLHIPLEADPEAPRRSGIKYTNYVLSKN